ncbi:hypothetical protein EDC04DRAFT_2677403 [Pisolithus marmoratus]|nr:hypothetical protein EDC04DRAFT_2677403 [Pisolithus marmoratus]
MVFILCSVAQSVLEAPVAGCLVTNSVSKKGSPRPECQPSQCINNPARCLRQRALYPQMVNMTCHGKYVTHCAANEGQVYTAISGRLCSPSRHRLSIEALAASIKGSIKKPMLRGTKHKMGSQPNPRKYEETGFANGLGADRILC